MRFIPNDIYEFSLPDGGPEDVLTIYGGQDYSPGQSRKNDIWLVKVPPQFAEVIPDGTEFDSYGQVIRTLAKCFCQGDVALTESHMVSTHKGSR